MMRALLIITWTILSPSLHAELKIESVPCAFEKEAVVFKLLPSSKYLKMDLLGSKPSDLFLRKCEKVEVTPELSFLTLRYALKSIGTNSAQLTEFYDIVPLTSEAQTLKVIRSETLASIELDPRRKIAVPNEELEKLSQKAKSDIQWALKGELPMVQFKKTPPTEAPFSYRLIYSPGPPPLFVLED